MFLFGGALSLSHGRMRRGATPAHLTNNTQGARGELEPEPGPLVFEARGEAEPEPEPRGELLPRRKVAMSLVGSAMLAEVRRKLPPRVDDDGGGAMLPSLGTRVAKHGKASLLLGSRLRCTGE